MRRKRGAAHLLREIERMVSEARQATRTGSRECDVIDGLLSAFRVMHSDRMRAKRADEERTKRKAKTRREIARLRRLVKANPVQEGDETAGAKIADRFRLVDEFIPRVLGNRMHEVLALLVGHRVPNDSAKELEKGAVMTAEAVMKMTPRELRLIGLDRATYDKLDAIFRRAEDAIGSERNQAHRDTVDLRHAVERIENREKLRALTGRIS